MWHFSGFNFDMQMRQCLFIMQTKVWKKKYHAVVGEMDKNKANFGESFWSSW